MKHKKKPVGRPPEGSEPAHGSIALRITKSRKADYMKAAKRAGKTLTDWMFCQCDKACIL